MHGHSPGYALVVKADVDSMGGVIDGGAGNDNKTSPRRAAIEKAQAELRQEYDVREERRRELEFLEKGGNPLDFRLASATSVSVQSTSFTDQLAEQFVTSEAKGSFALTASPHGDSVESIGRPGAPLGLEPNSSDNLLHFGGGNELIEGEMNSRNPVRKNKIVVPNQFSYLDGTPMEKKSEDSPVLPLIVKNQAYRRRNRSRTNRDNARASTNDLAQGHNGNDSSNIPSSRRGSRETKGSVCENHTQKARMTSSICSSLPTSPKGNVVIRTLASDCELDTDLEDVQVHRTDSSLRKPGQPEGETGVTALKDILDGDHIQHPEVDSQKTHGTTFMEPDLAGERVGGILAGFECSPSATTAKTEDKTSVSQLNGSSSLNKGGRAMKNEGQPESSFTQINQSLDGSNIGIQCPDSWNVCSNGNSKEQFEGTYDIGAVNVFREKSETKNVEAVAIINDHKSVHQNNSSNSSQVKFEGKIRDDKFSMQDVKLLGHFEGIKPNEEMVSETLFNDKSSSEKTILCPGGTQSTIDSFNCELTEATLSGRASTTAIELPSTMDNHQKIANKAREDSILEEARIVEAKRKRIAELSVGALPFENLRKSHWDFVVEEMAWLANDFMQERLWKISAAAQICNRIAFMGRLTFDEKNLRRKQRQVAHTLAKAVLQFWHSAAVLLSSDDSNVHPKDCKSSLVGSKVNNRDETPREMIGESNTLVGKCLDEQNSGKGPLLRVHEYAVRFLDYNRSLNGPVQAEAPVTPDKISDFGILDMSWEDQFSEESLFYMVPFGAMETYRKSVESQMVQSENTGSSIQEEVETSMYDTAADFISHENAYEEEGETSTYYMAGGFVASKPSKFSQKKHRNLPKSYATNSHRLAVDLRYGHCMEGNPGNQQSVLVGKRPASSPHVGSVPTKRVRTAARQRGPSPFNVGATVGVTATNKTDISSGDTSSFQDDQSTLHGGSQSRKIMEVESTGEFGKQLPFDCKEISTKPKKKKKAKHLGSAYEQRWQLDTMVQSEERDTSRKRLESHHFESNGSTGLFGQHVAKKPKIKHSLETSLESFTPVIGSVTSPAASQMSNMSNPNKLFKTVAGRDRGRKNKILKISPVQSGLGSPWSLFEDQALVVLVHDMGPNWELVSDAINSTLQFKCIFRKPKECKERHKILMDRNTGDGADSAEDSGSSQPYPSTLPGIPKGSARQLFQRLQGPMEEDTLKAHFEKIIFIGKQQLSRSCQNDNQDQKQRAPVHSSHVVALSQICLNKLNGGPLTPLDFCDATSGPDAVSLGYQGSQTSGLALSNQGSVVPLLHNSGANSMIPGSSNILLGNNLPSPSAASNVSHRDGRYSVPRAASLSIEEQQKMQQYSQMFPGRNIQQPSLSVPGPLSGNDRAVRMLPGGSGMGMICGMNRVPMPRPGYQGISSPSMLNSASMVPSNVMGLPSHVNMHAGAVSGQGNSMFRSHEPLHMMRPGHNPDDQRQMMMPDIQMQVTQGNSQSINGLTSAFSNQTIPPIQAYPLHHQQQHQMAPQPSHVLGNSHHSHLQGTNHATSPQHQSFMLRLAKERHLQQRLSQQQQQKFGGPNALMPHAHSQAQHAISSSLQNGFQIQQQSSSQPVSQPPPNSQHMLTPSSSVMTPISSQHQQKYQLPPHGLGRNLQAGGGFTNQMLKQRQRQQPQIQQPGRQHPQQRQQSQTQQQAKLLKGLGKGTMMMHQNLSNDPSHVNGLRTTSGNQAAEKGEQALHLIQGQGLCSGSGSNTAQLGKQLVPPSSNQCSPQQKLYTRPMPPSSKQLQQMPSVSDNSNPGQAPPDSSCHTVLVSQQMFPSLPVDSSPHHQQHPLPQPQPRHAVQSQQTVHRMIRQNHQVNSDTCVQSPVDQIQANQKQVNNVFQMDTNVTIPQSCTDSTRVFPVVSSANALQWKAPEPAYDSDVQSPVAHLNSIGNLPLSNSAGSEPVLSPSRSSSQRQFSGGIPAQGHNVGAQRQQHLQSLQQPPPLQQHQQPTLSPPLSPQEEQHQLQQQQLHYQHDQQNHQLPPQQSPAQQQQQPHQLKQSHLHYQEQQQAGQGSLYARPTNSGLG